MHINLEKLYDRAYDWMITVGPRIIIAVLIFALGQWLIRLLKRKSGNYMHRRNIDASLQMFFRSLFYVTLQVLLILLVMQIMGLQLTIFASIIAAFGVAAGLALSGTLQNFTSGVLILLLKPYRVGDNIIAQGQEGTITAIEIFYTVMTAYDNRIIIIPNSKLSNELIINLSEEGKRRMDIEIKLPFPSDYSTAEKIIRETAANSKAVMKESEVRVGVSLIEPDGYRVIVNAWARAHGFMDDKLLFQQQLVDDLKNGGVKLPGM
ncbi:mechanosensitive ion channel family protein [Deminuibacter soli]|uniref:Mechanosensitive ion channel family protein n=1 Tax=Deminuibacter soli TaxID=2291815 RepID=A0A3E1NED3_9BACT|nr:mechanosensitive ion channel family protein [Deminuibacter soli]RFM26330.1 mechanosensitive ion channel family protein [Deminuibacter soli]